MSIYIFWSTERFVPVTTRKECAYQKKYMEKKQESLNKNSMLHHLLWALLLLIIPKNNSVWKNSDLS